MTADNTTILRPLDIVIYRGESWIIGSVDDLLDGRARVAQIYQPGYGGYSATDVAREISVCYWRAAGELRPLALSDDGVIEITGRRHRPMPGI